MAKLFVIVVPQKVMYIYINIKISLTLNLASSCTEPPDNELERSQYQVSKRHCKGSGTKFYYFDNRQLKCLEKFGPPECPNVPVLFGFNLKEKSNNHFKTIGECREKCESTGKFI